MMNDSLIGSVWAINLTGTRFVVVDTDHDHLIVDNIEGPSRRRRILATWLHPSTDASGYTKIAGAAPDRRSEQ